MEPREHQLEKAEACWQHLREKGYVYLAGKPRSGKTYTAILVAEKSSRINSVLVLTQKNAIDGWLKFTKGNKRLKHSYTITNYEQAHKLKASDYQLVIIDESHNLGVIGKPTTRYKVISNLCKDLPHIHLSGTAIVESPNGIYHQMHISKFSPFIEKNFYSFFRRYGIPYYIKVGGREITQYNRAKAELLDYIDTFTVYMTQEDAGISSDFQATDVVHYVTLQPETRALYNRLQTNMVEENIGNSGLDLVCDNTMKLRTSLHMIESGVCKVGEQYILLGNTEKVDYIKEKFGDKPGVGIMCHFIGEKQLLQKHFKFATIYSSSSHAEGVDLSHLESFIIMSSDYRGSKFIQRRDRVVNMEGSNTTSVHHILVKKAVSEQVYNKVSKKEDFNNSTYERGVI